jgi:transposase-like protein
MLRRFFEWLFKKELAATEAIDINTTCPRCGNRAFYLYSLDDQTMYSCNPCNHTFGVQYRISPAATMAEQG